MNTPPTPDEFLDRALALGKLMDDLDDGKAEPVPLDQLDDALLDAANEAFEKSG